VNDSQHDEKDSKSDQNANMEIESSVKDENAESDSNKIKENKDIENKEVEETTDNKPCM